MRRAPPKNGVGAGAGASSPLLAAEKLAFVAMACVEAELGDGLGLEHLSNILEAILNTMGLVGQCTSAHMRMTSLSATSSASPQSYAHIAP